MADAEFFADLEIHRNKATLTEFYDKYADQYDEVMKPTGYSTLQEHIAKCLKERIDCEQALILDVGCGTGSSGLYLKKAGFDSIDGTDPSTKSLKVASNRNVYSKLFQGIITDKMQLSCPENTYDALTCVGCIAKASIEIRPAIQEFHRIVKPGGLALFTIRADDIDAMDAMEVFGEAMRQKKIELLVLQKLHYFDDKQCFCCIIKVLPEDDL